MAGSWHHLLKDDGTFARFAFLDNRRDDFEALEECFFLITYLTEEQPSAIESALKEYYKASRGEAVEAKTARCFARLNVKGDEE